MKRYSLKQRLVKRILIGVLFIIFTSLIGIYFDAKHEVAELFDANLAQSSRVLQGLLDPETIANNKQNLQKSLDVHDMDFDSYHTEATPHGHKYEKKLAFQVWDQQGKLLLKSPNANILPMALLQAGFSDKRLDQHQWRMFCLYSEYSKTWLIVAERGDIRAELTHAIALNHILPFLLIIPLLGALIWLTIDQGIKPLQSLVQQVGQQHYKQLNLINEASLPKEVNSLTQAINHLFQRLNQSYQNEQRFIADVAHELRNPLASLQIHNENAILDNKDSEVAESLNNVNLGIEQLSHLVQQLLDLSRADRIISKDEYDCIDLTMICQATQQQFSYKALQKQQILQYQTTRDAATTATAALYVYGIESLLLSLLGNLVDNALRYSPPNSQVEINCYQQDTQIVISVEDSGIGISDALKQQVQERFYRIDDTQQSGSGLGLSIVQRIAETHQATLQLSDAKLGGLCVSVSFPIFVRLIKRGVLKTDRINS
jgi:two-component system sensor histidine kinase QseC